MSETTPTRPAPGWHSGSPPAGGGDVAPSSGLRPEAASGTAAGLRRWPGARARRAALERLWVWWLGFPPWGQALAVYLLTRVLDFVIVDRVARFQVPSLWNGPNPGYLGVVSLWDGDWYRRIAENGYPTTIPRDFAGVSQQNAWAFYPLYPAVVRAVMTITGAGWPLAASTTSLVCGAAAVLVMRSLVEPVAGRSLALWTVALFSAFPSAPVLQLAYTESLSMLLVVSALWCLQRRHYLLAAAVVLLIGVSRPVAVPMAVVVGLHLLTRLRRRRKEPLPGTTLAALGLLAAASVLAAVSWTLIVGAVTGDPNGYTDTMAAWRVGHRIVLLKPWWGISQYLLGHWFGPAALLAVVVVLAWWLTRPQARVIAGDLRAWVVCYLGYLAFVLDPSTSLVRYLLAAFPFGTLLAAASPSRAYRRALVVAFVAGQVVWVAWLWRFTPPADWPP